MVKQLMSQKEEVRAEANEECVKERALWTALPLPKARERFCQLVGKVKQLESKLLSRLHCLCVRRHHCPLLGGIKPVHLLHPPAQAPACFWVQGRGTAPVAMLTVVLPWGELSSGMPTWGGSAQPLSRHLPCKRDRRMAEQLLAPASLQAGNYFRCLTPVPSFAENGTSETFTMEASKLVTLGQRAP